MALSSRRHSRRRRLEAYLRRRARIRPAGRPALDCRSWPSLTRRRAVVFTDTADFTTRTLRDGILHFLMGFGRAVAALRPVVRAKGGTVLKVEGDSMILLFADAGAACAGVRAMEKELLRFNRARPEDERFRFSYGIGYGEVVDLEDDVFGLEVNLASKLGEDLAKPGQVLLTPAAAAGLDAASRHAVVPYEVVPFKGMSVAVQQLRLGPGGPRRRKGRKVRAT